MECDCCHRRKMFYESFAFLETEDDKMNLCVDCNNLLYKLRDYANEGNREKFYEHLKQLEKRQKKPSSIFASWLKSFVVKLEEGFQRSPIDSKKNKDTNTNEKKGINP